MPARRVAKKGQQRQVEAGHQQRKGSIATELPTKTLSQMVDEICSKLRQEGHQKGPAYSLIIGAGFSYPIIPLTRKLLHEEIGDFYFPREDQSSIPREEKEKRELSADFWREFNTAGSRREESMVKLDEAGVPADPAAAYQLLFTYREANKLFAATGNAASRSFVSGLRQKRDVAKAKAQPERRVLGGEQFVKDFLRYALDPTGTRRSDVSGWKSDYYTAGRNYLNGAHFFLASLLELQQTGRLWQIQPFCRTIFTTNFDTLLQDALQLVNVLYRLTDRPERGFDISDFPEDEPVIHLVYTHGSILRHNPASTDEELRVLSEKNAEVLRTYLQKRDIIVLGYGGWPDTLMSALANWDDTGHQLYWCNVFPEDSPTDKLAPEVVALLKSAGGQAAYVCLGSEGADGLMARLLEALASADELPGLFRNLARAHLDRLRRVTLGNTLKAPAAQVLKTTLDQLEDAVGQIGRRGPTK